MDELEQKSWQLLARLQQKIEQFLDEPASRIRPKQVIDLYTNLCDRVGFVSKRKTHEEIPDELDMITLLKKRDGLVQKIAEAKIPEGSNGNA